MLKTQTKQQINEIRKKVKSSITDKQEFPSEDAVVEYAIQQLFTQLKKQGSL
jgi:hypothetical protein